MMRVVVLSNMRMVKRMVATGLCAGALVSCSDSDTLTSVLPTKPATPENQHAALLDESITQYATEHVQTHPTGSFFVQGLEFDKKKRLIMGTGLYGKSGIMENDYENNRTTRFTHLPAEDFGEGITVTDDSIWQLTWKEGKAYQRDPETFHVRRIVPYEGEGWGLCSFQDKLIMSDGTDTLRVLDPDTFEERERVQVTAAGVPIDRLNELECVGNTVYANIFTTRDIVGINFAGETVNDAGDKIHTGEVTQHIDASSLTNKNDKDPDNVLNGIAAIPETSRFLLSGKRWPDMYEVRFVRVLK